MNLGFARGTLTVAYGRGSVDPRSGRPGEEGILDRNRPRTENRYAGAWVGMENKAEGKRDRRRTIAPERERIAGAGNGVSRHFPTEFQGVEHDNV